MIIVADTAPINYLIQIGEIGLLADLYGRLILPLAVQRELLADGSPPPVRNRASSLPGWVRLEAADRGTLAMASAELDPGEREAITLAIGIGAELLVIDDRAGRREAARLNVNYTGTLGVLLAGSRRGLVNLTDAIDRLRQTNCFLSSEILEQVLRQGRSVF